MLDRTSDAPTDAPFYVYADNAATTPLSPRALKAMMPYLTSDFGNPSGIHRPAREAARALAEARRLVAALLNLEDPRGLYFTSGGSESDNWVLQGAVQRARDRGGADIAPRIITTQIEHHAILSCCRALERQGVEVTYLPVDTQGFVDPRDLESELAKTTDAGRGRSEAVALVSIMLANNEVGTIEPIRELSEISHAYGAPFHTDAVQAVGHIPVDVRELGIDALSLSAHKFHGPRGVGALYLRNGFSLPPIINGGAQERGVRAGTENVAGAVGMAEALLEACDGINERTARLAGIRDDLIEHIMAACPGVTPTGPSEAGRPTGVTLPGGRKEAAGMTSPADRDHPVGMATGSSQMALGIPAKRTTPPGRVDRLPSIASFVCDGVDGELLTVLLDHAGVAAATGSACSTGSIAPSHVLTAMGFSSEDAKGALRLSLADDITREELDLLKERVPEAIKRARTVSGVRW